MSLGQRTLCLLLLLGGPAALGAEALWPRGEGMLLAVLAPGTDPLAAMARLGPEWRLVGLAPGRVWLRATRPASVAELRARLGAILVLGAGVPPGCRS